jgi:hypothetical protein
MPEPTDREVILESRLAEANARIAELTRHDPVYRAAVRHFGETNQIRKTLEELAELSVALHHWLDGRGNAAEVCGEIADVEIMCAQMRIVFGSDKVDAAKVKKLDRLVRRMGGV